MGRVVTIVNAFLEHFLVPTFQNSQVTPGERMVSGRVREINQTTASWLKKKIKIIQQCRGHWYIRCCIRVHGLVVIAAGKLKHCHFQLQSVCLGPFTRRRLVDIVEERSGNIHSTRASQNPCYSRESNAEDGQWMGGARVLQVSVVTPMPKSASDCPLDSTKCKCMGVHTRFKF